MAFAPTTASGQMYRPGDPVLVTGDYEVVDEQGNVTDYEYITLDEGEFFPPLKATYLYYRLYYDEAEDLGGSSFKTPI